MAYLGSWKIDDFLTFYVNSHAATGVATDADAVPPYRIYEDETGAAIANANMALLDAANTAGFYSERIQLQAVTGFEKGKQYVIYISVTVGGIEGTQHHTFQIEAEVDANTVSQTVDANLTEIGGDAQSAVDLKDFADAGYDPATDKVQGVVLVDTTTTNTDVRGTDDAALAATALSTAVWTAARAGALTDWLNGERLDLILDIIAADVVNLDGDAMRGTNNALLAASVNVAAGIIESNLIQMRGVAQSAIDLTDFADAGYDPGTNQVEGVKLVDVTTTNTDMVATAPTAAAVVDEWETQSQADPTGFHVNVLEIGGTAQTANDNGADINTLISRVTAAVALASVCTEARLSELDGANIPADIDTLLVRLSAANAQAIADWIDGNRLDLLLDAVKLVTDRLSAMLEVDGPVYRYTTNALEQAPSGAGGDATAANQVLLLEDLEDVKGTGFVKDTDSLVDLGHTGADGDTLETLSDQMDAVGGGAGAITFPYTLTATGTGLPIADADVWVTSDLAGLNILGSGRTTQNGKVTFYLDAGTVYVWRQKSGWDFTNPDVEVVS